ncbi:MAG: mechanosensitive ion channel family protein, partial [Methylococcaceae bacterium]|nr:mechanosensitive ion channel family protein [Methylococcaceae bacterium]
NLERREHREVKTVLNITYDTPAERVQAFVDGVRQILENHPDTRKDNLQVRFIDFGPHSLDILVKFLIKAPNRLAELAERERIMLDILRLAEAQGVKFAFPTQSLYIEGLPDNQRDIATVAAP